MTSTSFNPVQINQHTIHSNQPISLRQGQVFHGTIKKLYPDQMAEVQVGNQKLFAKLETPLKAGDSHFFQVTNMNPQAELKVISGPMQSSQSTTQQISQLLDTMNLPKTQEMQQLLTHFVKNQLPIIKESLIQAEMWLKALPKNFSKQDAVLMIQRMIENKMPFTNEVFSGLLYGSKTTGMAAEMANLQNLLAKEANLSSEVKSALSQTLQTITKPFEAETSNLILSKAVQTLFSSTESNSSKTSALNFLKEANLLPNNAALTNWLEQSFQKAVTNGSQNNHLASDMIKMTATTNNIPNMLNQLTEWTQNQQLLTSAQKDQIQQLISRFEQLPKNTQTLNLFAKQLHELFIKAFTENSATKLFESNQHGISIKDQLLSLLKPDSTSTNATLLNLMKVANESNQPIIQNYVAQADVQIQSLLDGKAMGHALKTILNSLGMNYEASLSGKGENLQDNINSLKPQLLSIVQDAQNSQSLRDVAEGILGRLNGMQLHSGENGHQHQLIMQVPLQFFGKNTDATIQWNGRMKENGKIDANFARILFYLNMEAIQETVVDMQVQNRIVTIHLYNDNPMLEKLAEPLKEALKVGLSEKEYQLSGLFIKSFEKKAVKNAPEVSKREQVSKLGNGVDFRV